LIRAAYMPLRKSMSPSTAIGWRQSSHEQLKEPM
jgi:hypothetical protein